MRELSGFERHLTNIVAVGFALFFMYAMAVTLPFYVTVPLYICLSFLLVFCLYPATVRSPKHRISLVDYLFCALTLGITAFFFLEQEHYVLRPGLMRTQDLVVGAVAIVVSLEACRRVLGLALPLLAAAGIAYAMWGFVVPGDLGHRGFSTARVVGQIFSFEGIYGSVTAIYSTYVLLFVIFGAVIQSSGMSSFLLDLSNALVGRLKGGTAKTAIISSGIIGSVMGSGAANVAVTGSFTIPLMKRQGYPAHTAGAIETVASAGGVLAPPIMGSTAFILAAFTQTSYRDVALYSFIPALLFFWGIYIQAHFLSHRLDIALSDVRTSAFDVLRRGGHMLLPIVIIFVLIFGGMTAYRAGLWTIAATIALHYLRPLDGKRMGLGQLLLTFGEGAKLQLSVAASAGAIGIIITTLVLPGLPLKLASFAVNLAAGNLFILLLLMIVVSYVFGMGIPMVAAYIVLSVIAVPALLEIGLPLFNAHLIIMWFSLAALWTPPVAVGAFVASGIAGASPSAIGWTAVRLGIGLYIIPFLMAYGTIINGTVPEILFAGASIAIGLYGFAAAVEGWTWRPLQIWERVAYAVVSVIAIYPSLLTRGIGLTLFVAALAVEHWRRGRAAAPVPQP